MARYAPDGIEVAVHSGEDIPRHRCSRLVNPQIGHHEGALERLLLPGYRSMRRLNIFSAGGKSGIRSLLSERARPEGVPGMVAVGVQIQIDKQDIARLVVLLGLHVLRPYPEETGRGDIFQAGPFFQGVIVPGIGVIKLAQLGVAIPHAEVRFLTRTLPEIALCISCRW